MHANYSPAHCSFCAHGVAPLYTLHAKDRRHSGRQVTVCHTCRSLGRGLATDNVGGVKAEGKRKPVRL